MMEGKNVQIDIKTQKRRRRSLDESLINPIKAFVGSARLRRQSTTDASHIERSPFYNSDRRRRRSENELLSKLPFQDTTKERIRSAVTKSPSFKDTENKKHTPTMLRRISRHLIRQAYSDACDERRRYSINELDETPTSTPETLRHVSKSFDKTSNCDTSSLSTTDSGIDSRDDKTGSSDENERSDFDFDALDGTTRDKVLSIPPVTTLTNRSLSVNDVTTELTLSDQNQEAKPVSIRRQYSLREERSKMVTVSPSPMILRKSNEKLNLVRDRGSSDEKITNSSSTNNKSVSKKKKLLQPLVNRIRKSSLGRNEHHGQQIQQQQKLLIVDNTRLEQIVSEILQEKMKGLEYDHQASNDRCRLLSTSIERTLKLRLVTQPGNPEYKIIALVYIGETRDNGICFATQCSYEPLADLFATATYQHENMYVCAAVMATVIQQRQ